MPESARDFEGEFDEIMVGLAAMDDDLVDNLSWQMFGEGEDHPDIFSSSLAREVKLGYALNHQMFSRSVGICVAKLAGIKTGAEFFSE